jgi:hypothetical protein
VREKARNVRQKGAFEILDGALAWTRGPGSRGPGRRPRVPAPKDLSLHGFRRAHFVHSRAVSAEQVAVIPQCPECGELCLAGDADRWRAYLDTDDRLNFYCPDRAVREFGERSG